MIINKTPTVTLPLDEYKALEVYKKAFEGSAVIFRGEYGYFQFMDPDEAAKSMAAQIEQLKRDVEKMKQSSLLKRVLNKW